MLLIDRQHSYSDITWHGVYNSGKSWKSPENLKSFLEILDISWNFIDTPGKFNCHLKYDNMPVTELVMSLNPRNCHLTCFCSFMLYITESSCVFTVRRIASHGICDSNSVRLSVCLSVPPSVCHSWTVSTWFNLRS